MNQKDVLTVAGIVCTVVLGVPPTVGLFRTGNTGLAVFAILLGLVLLIVIFLFWRMNKAPNWTITRHEARIEILDASGAQARYQKEMTLRANRSGIDTYTHRNISADGKMDNFTVELPDRVLEAAEEAGDYRITVQFPTQVGLWQNHTTCLTADCHDCFTGQEEAFVVQVDQPIKKAKVVVEFPKGCGPAPDTAIVIFRDSGRTEDLGQPSIRDDLLEWEYSRWFRSLPYGEYEVRWHWSPTA